MSDFQSDIETISRIAAVSTILEVICRTTGMGFAAVARVTDDRWVACSVRDEIGFGLIPGGELKVDSTICHEIRQSGALVVIDHVAEDKQYCQHHTPAQYGFQSYISMPIILSDGRFFGTLCAIDPKPANLNNPETIGMFKLFSELITFHINAVERLAITDAQLQQETATAALREQFIAILGHDLRNPLSAISSASQLLLKMPLSERGIILANMIQDSCYRMTSLIESVIDFARGRLTGGMTLNSKSSETMEKIIRQVIAEYSVTYPQHRIETEFSLAEPVNCDVARISQMFSNLLGNAVKYGDAQVPVRVMVASGGGEFSLSVRNCGQPIEPQLMQNLFKPFSRGNNPGAKDGLGLGLYIAAEIARAHDGTLDVVSDEVETSFTLTMPSQSALAA